jgi:hypothetical protein
MRHLSIVLLVLIVSLGHTISFAGQRAPVSAKPDQFIWSASLHKFGLTPGKDTLHHLPEYARYGALFFLDDKTLVATFVIKQEVPGLQRRNDPNLVTPYKLHAILFDAASGKVIKELGWGSMGPDVGFAGRSDGNLLIISYDRVVVVSRENEFLMDIKLPAPSIDNDALQRYRISPTGNTVVIQYGNQITTECVTVHTLAGTSSLDRCEMTADSAVSDNGMAVSRFYGKGGPGPEVWIRNFDEPFQLLCHAPSGCGSLSFVNNETLLMYNRSEISLTKATGETLFHQKLDTFAGYGFFDPRPIRSSANGRRFGVLVANGQANMPILMSGLYVINIDAPASRLQVYDTAAHAWVFVLQNKDGLLKFDLCFAFSPSGELMALVINGVLRVYALPPAGSADVPH